MRALIAAVVGVVVAMPVAAQCTSYMNYGASTKTSISIYQGTGWTTAPPLFSAVSIWKNGCIGMAGRDFPALSVGTAGQMSIAVSYKTGPNTQRDGGCAVFDHGLGPGPEYELTGGTILIFQKTHAGDDCAWAMAHAVLDNLIAHELGHVLGLANADSSACDAYIMGNHWAAASVQDDECEHVDDGWDMPNEPADDPPPDEETCLPGCTTPVIISLRGDYRLTSMAGGVVFDIDADGVTEQVAWPEPDSGLAFLSMDRNGNGRIDDGAELFGQHTRLENGENAPNGFEALQEIDADGNAVVDANDPAWRHLLLWFDIDHDGQSSAEELVPAAATEMIAIGTGYRWSGRKDQYGNLFRYKGEVTLTVGMRRFYDVYLRTSDH